MMIKLKKFHFNFQPAAGPSHHAVKAGCSSSGARTQKNSNAFSKNVTESTFANGCCHTYINYWLFLLYVTINSLSAIPLYGIPIDLIL